MLTRYRSAFVVVAVAAAVAVPVAKVLLGQARRPAAADAPREGAKTVHVPPQAVPEIPPSHERARLPPITHHLHFDTMDAAVAGRTVHLVGSVEVFDRTCTQDYVWMVRAQRVAADRSRSLAHEHHYLETAVRPPAGETSMTAHFDDTIELPTGRYAVELRLYPVPRHSELRRPPAGLDADRRFRGVHRSVEVVIAEEQPRDD
jgi:hypothetical protein